LVILLLETFDLERFGCFKEVGQLVLRNMDLPAVHIEHYGM